MLLTDEQALALSTRCNSEAYNLLGSLWDRVIDASVDAGCDYEGMGVEVTEIVADKDKSGRLK